MAKWLPPDGFTGTVHHADAKVGGTYKMSFRNFTTRRRATRSAANMSSSCPANGSATPISSTIRTWAARSR